MKKKRTRPLPSYEVLDFLAKLRASMHVREAHYFELRRLAFKGAMMVQLIWHATLLDIDVERALE